MSEPIRNFTSAVRVINEFIDDEPDFKNMPIEQIKAILKADEININDTVKAVKLMVNKEISSGQLKVARQLRDYMLNLIRSAEQKHSEIVRSLSSNMSRQEILDQIKLLAGGESGQIPAAYFRNLEECAEADLKTLMDDFKFLNELEDDEKRRTQAD